MRSKAIAVPSLDRTVSVISSLSVASYCFIDLIIFVIGSSTFV